MIDTTSAIRCAITVSFSWIFLTFQPIFSQDVRKTNSTLVSDKSYCFVGERLRSYNLWENRTVTLSRSDTTTLTCNALTRGSNSSDLLIIFDVHYDKTVLTGRTAKVCTARDLNLAANKCNGLRNCKVNITSCDETVPSKYCKHYRYVNFFCIPATVTIDLSTMSDAVIFNNVVLLVYTSLILRDDASQKTVCEFNQKASANMSFVLFVLRINLMKNTHWKVAVQFGQNDASTGSIPPRKLFDDLKFSQMIRLPHNVKDFTMSFEGRGKAVLLLKGPGLAKATISCKHMGGQTTVPPPPTIVTLAESERKSSTGPKNNIYIGLGAGIGGLILLLIPMAVFVYLRKCRRKEQTPQTTGEHYAQPMKTIRKKSETRGEANGNSDNEEQATSVNSESSSYAPPPIPTFPGMEKSDGREGDMYVNMTPTAPVENSKVRAGKRKRRAPRGKQEKKQENHASAEYDSTARSLDRPMAKPEGADSELEYSYADRYRPTEIMKKVMDNPPKSTSSDNSYSESPGGSNFTYDYANAVHDM